MTPPNRLLLLGSVLALAACGPRSTPSPAIPPADPLAEVLRGPFVAGHLYVSLSGDAGHGPIERYPIVDGAPAVDPDLAYPANLGGAFGVDSDGTLYAQEDGKYPYYFHMAVFGPNSNRIARRIIPHPQPYQTYPTSVIGRAGFVYLAFEQNTSAQRRFGRGQPAFPCAFFGIAVYGPKAHDLAPYLTCFATTFGAVANGISLGPDGNLYSLSSTPSGEPAVDVYGNLASSPTLLRTMYGDSFAGASGIANDDEGHLYVAATAGRDRAFIGVYGDTGSGPDKPARAFDFREPQTWGNANAAVDDRYVYVSTVGEVLVFDKLARGYARPVATLLLPKINFSPAIAIGP
jgi:hypothetical protein